MEQGYLGLKTNADKWDNLSEARQQNDWIDTQKELADLQVNFSATALSPAGRLSYRLYKYRCER